MPDLIEESNEAVAWLNDTKIAYSGTGVFGKVVSCVIWSDAKGPDGDLLVPIDPVDAPNEPEVVEIAFQRGVPVAVNGEALGPVALVENINATDYPLLKGHDPGFPLGKALRAAVFTSSNGTTFVAALLGLYAGTRISFSDFELDPASIASSPASLPVLPDTCWINVATDPREIEPEWLEDALHDAPLRVERTVLSHNAADAPQELIRLGLLFLILVWNPYVTSIATEAGKATYAGLHSWMRTLLTRLAERKNPVLEVQSFHGGCCISFVFRGTDVHRHYAAHDALPGAAAQAAQLVANLKNRGRDPMRILYEFHPRDMKWFPSYAELDDGRLITDNVILVAVEQLPSGLSLGISRGGARPRLPNAKGFSDLGP